jgi:hypothetical protein
MDKSEFGFDSYAYPSSWYFSHSENNMAVSDEFTKGLFQLYICSIWDENYQSLKNRLVTIRQGDIIFLLKGLNIDDQKNKYYIINSGLNVLRLLNWVSLKSWNKIGISLEDNIHIKKIYDGNDIYIFSNF